MCGGDAVNEDELVLCCALCCVNCGIYPACDCVGCSGKGGILCCNAECCLKMGAPCLAPFVCVGCKPACNECSVINGQCQACCLVTSCAIPCNSEVPPMVSVAGLTMYPACGCCLKQKTVMERS